MSELKAVDMEDEKIDHPVQIDKLEKGDQNVDYHDRQAAMNAEMAEQSMTFKEAIRDYKSAVFWSWAISLCIIMEGYDTALPVSLCPDDSLLSLTIKGNFIGIPAFREKFGEYVDEQSGYQLTPAWQAGLGQCSGIGSILSVPIFSSSGVW
jgi:SP family general alpha glucoside:H+ symporter-like MFS transporter